MGRQIVHRLLVSFPALLGVLFLCFCLLQVVPADPAMIIAGPEAKAETIAAIRLELGLDRPIPIQFAEYIGRVLRGDLGRSIISNKMVSEELALTIGPDRRVDAGRHADRRAARPGAGHLRGGAARPAQRSRHHGGLGGGRFHAGVLHRPDPDPVCRLQVGAAAFHRPHRTDLGRRPAEPDPAGADAGPGADRPDRAADAHRRARSAGRRLRAHRPRQGPARDGGDHPSRACAMR